MRFKFIDAEKARYPLTILCRVMQVSRWGYDRWWQRKSSAHAQRDKALLVKIRTFHDASHKRYGSPRIFKDLRANQEAVSKKRVARLMRDNGIVGKHRQKFRCTTDSNHNRPVAPNLLKQQFHAPRPDAIWASDITQLRTPEGWLYLAVVLDLFARTVVGWALRADITQQLVLDAVTMAIRSRNPREGLIFHSDRGSQYAAADTEALLRGHGITPSMSSVGNCFDNAVSESFFSGLKIELGDTFPSQSQGRSDIFQFIETYYNPYRRHSFNADMSPQDCEAFFERTGRRPTHINDLVAANTYNMLVTRSQGKGAPSSSPGFALTSITAVETQCTEVQYPSI